jgi:hypothetical protein
MIPIVLKLQKGVDLGSTQSEESEKTTKRVSSRKAWPKPLLILFLKGSNRTTREFPGLSSFSRKIEPKTVNLNPPGTGRERYSLSWPRRRGQQKNKL